MMETIIVGLVWLFLVVPIVVGIATILDGKRKMRDGNRPDDRRIE